MSIRTATRQRAASASLVPIVLIAAVIAAACGSSSSTTTAVGPTPVKCPVTVTLASPLDAAGGVGKLAVATQPECTWTVAAEADWISALSPDSGQGNGEVTFHAAPNPDGVARQAGVLVSGQRAMISQAAATCRFDIQGANSPIAAAAGSVSLTVTAPNGCSWQAQSASSWVTVIAGSTGSGNGIVTLSIGANSGEARSGGVTVAGQPIVLSQMAAGGSPATACTYAVQPTAAAMPANGGTGTLAVAVASACAWTATSSAPWLTVTSGGSGPGPGNVSYAVAANTGAARSATLSIAGTLFAINQAANCSVSINPASLSPTAAGGSGGPIAVSAAAGCTWAATSSVAWLTVLSGASGSGNGSVTVSVAPNTGGARTGTLSIGSQSVTVNQAAAAVTCTYSIAPSSQSVGAAGGAGTQVNVTTTAGCAWTAASGVAWISIASGATGSGSGSVSFTVASNTGAERTGSLTIAGQPFSVTQAAAAPVVPCTYAINPSSQSIGAAGGAGSQVSVTTSSGCAWTAASNAGWISISSGASGSGNGAVSFSIAANTGSARTGTLTIAGSTFTVNQAAACTYAINPTSTSAPKRGSTGSTSVTAPAGCAWTAASNVSWISVLSGASGSGNGTVTFEVAENDKGKRTGTLTIAGRVFTVDQD